ncbi:MAG: DUF4190 domain-containing protein [Oscillospiraceae bacterium]|nr:DUF4190 domain-containing protein [Oscillospiraceae bacterium]
MTNKNLAILGLVLSFLVPLAGLIISAVALNKFKESGETDGKGLATAGLIIGIVIMALGLVGTICSFACAGCLAAAGGSY